MSCRGRRCVILVGIYPPFSPLNFGGFAMWRYHLLLGFISGVCPCGILDEVVHFILSEPVPS